MKVIAVGTEEVALSLRGERLLLPALLFTSIIYNVSSAFFQLKSTLKSEYPESPKFFGNVISAWDSNPRLDFLAVPVIELNQR